jgi:hypothetical protein
LLWNLLGGNVREPEKLVSRYRWDVKTWLQNEVINFIRDVLKANIDLRTFKDVNEVLEAIIEKGKVAARDYGLGGVHGPTRCYRGGCQVLGKQRNDKNEDAWYKVPIRITKGALGWERLCIPDTGVLSGA